MTAPKSTCITCSEQVRKRIHRRKVPLPKLPRGPAEPNSDQKDLAPHTPSSTSPTPLLGADAVKASETSASADVARHFSTTITPSLAIRMHEGRSPPYSTLLPCPTAGHNACAGAKVRRHQSWDSRRRMRGSGSIGRRQRVVIEVVHMQPQYTPATRAAACARTRRWTPAARDMAMRMLADGAPRKAPWALSHAPRIIAVGRRDASTRLFFIHSHFSSTHTLRIHM